MKKTVPSYLIPCSLGILFVVYIFFALEIEIFVYQVVCAEWSRDLPEITKIAILSP